MKKIKRSWTSNTTRKGIKKTLDLEYNKTQEKARRVKQMERNHDNYN